MHKCKNIILLTFVARSRNCDWWALLVRCMVLSMNVLGEINMTILRWVLAIALAAFLIFMGVPKLGGANPVFSYLAQSTGLALFEPGIRMLTGIGEILAALLLLWPRSRWMGLAMAFALISGALAFHLSPFLGINAPVAFAIDGAYIKSTSLFFMAVGFLCALFIAILVERKAHGH